MHLGSKISGMELGLPSAWRCGYSLNHALRLTAVIKCKSRHAVLLRVATQVYANLQRWRTAEVLLEYLQREFYAECTLVYARLETLNDVLGAVSHPRHRAAALFKICPFLHVRVPSEYMCPHFLNTYYVLV